jgi:MoaA/NifB/PqqE/SkfB family radical SAM enzyme
LQKINQQITNNRNKAIMKSPNPKNKIIHVATSGCCNNNCIFCADRENGEGGFSSMDLFSSLYKKPFLVHRGFKKFCAKQKKALNILFTSGEPTLNPYLFDFIKSAKESGYRNVSIQTNGRRLSYKPFCIKLLESGINEVSVSIHGSCAKIHDSLTRSPGSFRQAMQGLSNLIFLKETYSLKIITTFTITKINYRDMYFYIKLIMSLKKVDQIALNTLMYTGNAKRFFSKIFVAYLNIVLEFKKTLDKIKIEGGDVPYISLSPVPLCLMKGYERYVGKFENPFQIKRRKVVKLCRDSQQLKSRECKKCAYFFNCDGFDSFYYKRMGPVEIRPFSLIESKNESV